jgi:hypothetical protein
MSLHFFSVIFAIPAKIRENLTIHLPNISGEKKNEREDSADSF